MKTKTKHPPFCPWPTKLFWKVTVNAFQHQYHICMPSTIPHCLLLVNVYQLLKVAYQKRSWVA